MIDQAALLESQTLRSSVLERSDVLDKVKALSLLPDGMHVTTAMVAAYFEVTVEAVRALVHDHRTELQASGYQVLAGTQLSDFKQLSGIQSRTRSLALFSRRAVLNAAMLLRDSEIARQVRVYLLDMEYLARTQPVENPVHRKLDSLDDRITRILGKTVVPMFNALIATAGEHRHELIELRQDIENVERRLCQHHRRISFLEEGRAPEVAAALKGMTWQALERHVADLLRRDGCTDVVVRQAHKDRGIDVTARTADGRTVAVQCKNHTSRRSIRSADMQKFAGAARAVDRVDVALFVATCNFSSEAQAIANLSGVIMVDRDELEAWSAGAPLKGLR